MVCLPLTNNTALGETMPLEYESEDADGIETIYSWDTEAPDTSRKLVFRIDAAKEVVEFFPRDEGFHAGKIVFDGFKRVPPELNEAGYIKTKGVQYHLSQKLSALNVRQLKITKSGEKLLQKSGKEYRMVLPYGAFQQIVEGFKGAVSEMMVERRSVVDGVFHGLFPRKYATSAVSASRRLTRLMSGLDESVVEKMDAAAVDRVLDFTKLLLEKRYARADKRRELFSAAKLKVDDVALADVIGEFERLLAESPNEATSGKFLRKNLFLVESRYVHVIERLNVVLGGSREVDFGMVDSQGFLDLFEIKTPRTSLLASGQDRGNHFWHTDTVKAIVQAEKYLYNAMQNALTLAHDIERERGIKVRVIRPRAVVIVGSGDQLDTPAKAEDFRVLRMSLRNIEIVLYDEFLQSLKNQRGKIYLN